VPLQVKDFFSNALAYREFCIRVNAFPLFELAKDSTKAKIKNLFRSKLLFTR